MASNDEIIAKLNEIQHQMATRKECPMGFSATEVDEVRGFLATVRHWKQVAGDTIVRLLIGFIVLALVTGAALLARKG